MDLPSSPATARVVALGYDDTWTHAFPTLDSLLAHNDQEAAPLGAMEFFDTAGARLATVFDPTWRLVGLQPTGEPDPDRLQRRLQAVLRHVAAYLRNHPEVAGSLPDLPEDIDERLQKLAESDLDSIVVAIEAPSGGVRPLHSAGFIHNALHAAGWTHD